MRGLAILFFVIAVGLVIAGFVVMFNYDSTLCEINHTGSGCIVGSDAYNYIILAVRSVGFIGSGAVAGILGHALLMSKRVTP